MAASSRSVVVAPSILSADFGRLGEEVQAVEQGGADWIHVDVMDGRFVPNLTIGPLVVRAVRQATRIPIDAHLMIVEPERYIDAFAEAGADWITVHAEACTHLQRALSEIRSAGKKAGVALNPHTPEHVLDYVLETVDLVLLMTVNPGFGGQRFLAEVVPKIERVRDRIQQSGRPIRLEVDGGINKDTSAAVARAGADVLVAGHFIFGQADYAKAISALREGASR